MKKIGTWSDVRAILASRTGKLTLSYLGIIMTMSLGFSVVFYHTSSQQLGRQIPSPGTFQQALHEKPGDNLNQDEVNQFLQQRVDEGRHTLLTRIFFINLAVLLGGTALSCFLARATLAPIEAAIESQSRFIGDASHELRTPLTAIQTSNEVVLRRKNLTLEQAKEALASNIEEVYRLRELTDSLLSIAKQERVAIVAKPLDVQEVVGNAMNHVIATAQAKDITIDDNAQRLTINSNKHRLEQVLVILLDNAIKYSHEHSTIKILSAKKGKHCFITVKDNGMGIRAADLPNIFKRFYRADQARTKDTSSGYGLGLSIAEKITIQLGGEITVKSQPNKGSTFTIKLPA